MSDTQRTLRNHACFVSIFDRRGYVANVIQTAKSTGNVRSLRFLYLIKQLSHISRNWAHTQTVQRTVQHMGLNTCFMKRLCPGTYGLIGVFAKQQIYLFEAATVGFNTGKTSHFDDSGSYFHQLVYTWHILTGTLPHVPEYQAELYFFLHTLLIEFVYYFFSYRLQFLYFSHFSFIVCHYRHRSSNGGHNIGRNRGRRIGSS